MKTWCLSLLASRKHSQLQSDWLIILFAHSHWSTLIMTSSKRTISLKNSYKFHQNTFLDLVRCLLIYSFLQRGFIYFADRIESFKSFKTLELLAMVSVPLLTPSWEDRTEEILETHNHKMNIFRLVGDISHLLAILLLLWKVWKTRSCAGQH